MTLRTTEVVLMTKAWKPMREVMVIMMVITMMMMVKFRYMVVTATVVMIAMTI